MSAAACEAVIADFYFGPKFCGNSAVARIRVADDLRQVDDVWVCSEHLKYIAKYELLIALGGAS